MQRKITHSLKVIAEAIENYPKIAVASSFGKDSVVTVHLAKQIDPKIQVFWVLTPFKPLETREYGEQLKEQWNLNLQVFETPAYAEGYEHISPESGVEECCEYYKVQPTKQAIKELELEAWISGLRATEGTEHREKFTKEVELDKNPIKINPILEWSEADVWLYHCINNIPPHPLYSRGYRSLGCAPCSAPYTETERGGRWKGTDKCGGECGIHTKSLR